MLCQGKVNDHSQLRVDKTNGRSIFWFVGKGQATREVVLDQALDLCTEVGLEGLSFGVLAKLAGMSKSGLYAHFDSKESLQCAVLDAAAQRFVDVVVAPALKEPRGLPRLEKLFERWLDWESNEFSGGCPFIAAGTEFDDRKGRVRTCLIGHFRDLSGAIGRAARIAIEEKHLRNDLDVDQFTYEFWAILVAHHHYRRLLADPNSDERAHQTFRTLIARSSR